MGLFSQIVDEYKYVEEALNQIDSLVDEYNKNCADKCLPGYVRCYGDDSGKCILECDCCTLNSLSCCDSDNHPANTFNYATGDKEVLNCYDWCCPDDNTYCDGNCYKDSLPLPYGHGAY